MGRIIELKWNCADCDTKGILGRYKECPTCGSPREKGEMRMDGLNTDQNGDGYNDAVTVTDSSLVNLAKAGADWFCTHCTSGNIGNGDRCNKCGAPRYGQAEENHPDFPFDHLTAPTPDIYSSDFKEPIETPKTPPKPDKIPSFKSDEAFPPKPIGDGLKILAIIGGAILVLGMIVFGVWAFRTHEVEGRVSQTTWVHYSDIYSWQDTTVKGWRDETSERSEVKPVNGSGERAGMNLVSDSCKKEHHHYEEYQCGTTEESYECGSTESFSTTCTGSESYVCGESCSDNGNGFATCTDTYCYQATSYPCIESHYVSKTCQRTVPKYCERSIKKDRCIYTTQKWVKVNTLNRSGIGMETAWPTPQLSKLEKQMRRGEWNVVISYRDRGEYDTYTIKPNSEADYKKWNVEQAKLNVNNLGGVRNAYPIIHPK